MSDQHVDVVQNDWLAGTQRVVARLWIERGSIRFESADEPTWRPILIREIADPETGKVVSPSDPGTFLEVLARSLHGTYLFATTPHAKGESIFDEQDVVGLRTVSEG